MSARTRRRWWLPPRDDRGFTLMEVMVGSAIMSAVMVVATSGFVTMFRTTDKAESAALTQTSLMAAFSKLDRDVRYAFRVNTPGTVDDTYYVDYVIPNPAVDAAEQNKLLRCVRLSLPVAGGSLVRREWPQGGTSSDPSATVGTVAVDLVTGRPGASPFTTKPAGDADSNFDRLAININSTVGVTGIGTTRNYDLLFTALNTEDRTRSMPCTA